MSSNWLAARKLQTQRESEAQQAAKTFRENMKSGVQVTIPSADCSELDRLKILKQEQRMDQLFYPLRSEADIKRMTPMELNRYMSTLQLATIVARLIRF